MHFVIATEGIPNPISAGGALTGWSVINSLKKKGHKITSCAIMDRQGFGIVELENRNLNDLKAIGVDVMIFSRVRPSGHMTGFLHNMRRLVPPSIRMFYPMIDQAQKIADAIDGIKPDAVFAYDFPAIAAVSKVKSAPILGIGGSFRPLTTYYRWKNLTPVTLSIGYLKETLMALIGNLEYKYMIEILSKCRISGHFAAHHAKELKDRGASNARHFNTPVVDMLNGKWEDYYAKRKLPAKLRILMIGHLKNISTLAGLYMFAYEILPELEKRLGPDGFEAHIVGRFEPPDDLKKILNRPSIHLRGFVDDIVEEFSNSHVCLVAGEVKFSLRVRILTALCFGACVVSHSGNVPGIPEIIHGENALIANSGKELAYEIIRAYEDSTLREKIEKNARKTYAKYFSPEVAGGKLADTLEAMATDIKI